MDTLRLLLAENAIQNKTLNPYNEIYYSEIYNNLSNETSVFLAPMYASKPYYYQCKNL